MGSFEAPLAHDGVRRMLVARKSGVMDPVAQTIARALVRSKIWPGHSEPHVTTFRVFQLRGEAQALDTKLMKELDYGKGYRYAHDEPDAFAAGENYFPEEIADTRYYFPVEQGLEKQIREKLERLRALNSASGRKRYGKGEITR